MLHPYTDSALVSITAYLIRWTEIHLPRRDFEETEACCSVKTILNFLRHAWLSIGLLIVVIIGTVYVVRTKRVPGSMTVLQAQATDMNAMRPAVGAMPVTTETVVITRFGSTATYTGSVAAYNDEDIVARVTGRVLKVAVYPGDRVSPGQLLVQLDAVELSSKANEAAAAAAAARQRVAAARQGYEKSLRDAQSVGRDLSMARFDRQQGISQVAAARATLTFQQGQARRDEMLYRNGAVSQQELQSTHTDLATARNEFHNRVVGVDRFAARIHQVEFAQQAALATARQSEHEIAVSEAEVQKADAEQQTAQIVLGYSVIVAPHNAEVSERVVSPGTLVMPGTVLLRIKQTDRLRLQARVSEEHAMHVRVGGAVVVRVRGRTDAFSARVTAVFPAANADSRTFTVEAIIPGAFADGTRLRPGQFVEMQIDLDAPQRTVSVPLEALRHDLAGLAFVWRVDKGQAGLFVVHRQDVTPGTEDGQRVAISHGLGAGARVVVRGGVDLADGMTVSEVRFGPQGPAEMPSPSASSDAEMKDMPGMQMAPSSTSPQAPSHPPSPSVERAAPRTQAPSPSAERAAPRTQAPSPPPTPSMPPMPGMP